MRLGQTVSTTPATTTTTASSPVFLRKAPGRVRGRRCFRWTAVLKYMMAQGPATRNRTLKSISNSARPSPHSAIRFGPCAPYLLTFSASDVHLHTNNAVSASVKPSRPSCPPPKHFPFYSLSLFAQTRPAQPQMGMQIYRMLRAVRPSVASTGISTPWSDILLQRAFSQAEPAAVNTVKSVFSSPCRPLYQFM